MPTASATARRCAAASTCSRGCWPRSASTPTSRSSGLEIELNLVDDDGDPALKNAEVLEAIADPDFQTELGQFNIEINVAAAPARATAVSPSFEESLRAQPQRRRGPSSRTAGAHMVMIGILPTLDGEHLDAERAQRQPALRAAQRADLRRARRGPRRSTSAASSGCRPTPTRSRPRRRARASSSTAGRARRRSPRYWNAVAGDRRRPGRRRRQLAVPPRQGAVARDPHRRCSSRPPTPAATSSRRRACARGCGSASAGSPRSSTCSRRTSATSRRCCRCTDDEDPVEVLDARRHPRAARAAPAQRHDLPLEPPGLRRRARAPAPAGREPRPARRADRRRHARQRGLLLRPGAGRSPRRTGRCGRRCRSRRPRRTSTSAAQRRHRRAASTGPGSGEVPATELVLRRLLPLAHEGLDRLGRRPRRARPAARHHRAPLRRRSATAPPGRRPSSTSLYDERGLERDARCAR